MANRWTKQSHGPNEAADVATASTESFEDFKDGAEGGGRWVGGGGEGIVGGGVCSVGAWHEVVTGGLPPWDVTFIYEENERWGVRGTFVLWGKGGRGATHEVVHHAEEDLPKGGRGRGAGRSVRIRGGGRVRPQFSLEKIQHNTSCRHFCGF